MQAYILQIESRKFSGHVYFPASDDDEARRHAEILVKDELYNCGEYDFSKKEIKVKSSYILKRDAGIDKQGCVLVKKRMEVLMFPPIWN